jgi:hypothetical protein
VLTRHRGAWSLVGGAAFALVAFVVGGGGRPEIENVGLALLVGTVFAVMMFRAASRGRPS